MLGAATVDNMPGAAVPIVCSGVGLTWREGPTHLKPWCRRELLCYGLVDLGQLLQSLMAGMSNAAVQAAV